MRAQKYIKGFRLLAALSLICAYLYAAIATDAAASARKKAKTAPRHSDLPQITHLQSKPADSVKESKRCQTPAETASSSRLNTAVTAGSASEQMKQTIETDTEHAAKQEAVAAAVQQLAQAAAKESRAPSVAGKRLASDPSPSFASVLADLARAINYSGAPDRVNDKNSRKILALAGHLLERALAKSTSSTDRIIGAAGQKFDRTTLSHEAWNSGEVKLDDGSIGSIAAVWGKRPNGLINVTIAGDASGGILSDKRTGQFLVVLSGRSALQKGFDIQSNGDVDYWLAELHQISVESDRCSSVSSISEAQAKRIALKKLPPSSWKSVKAEIKEGQPVTGSASVEGERNFAFSSHGEVSKEALLADQSVSDAIKLRPEASQILIHRQVAFDGDDRPGELSTSVPSGEGRIRIGDPNLESANQVESLSNSNTPLLDVNLAEASESPAKLPIIQAESAARTNASGIALILPERAIAGEPLTASVARESENNAKQHVQVSFNGVVVGTDDDGKAVFTVPEDSQPGKTLKVSLAEGFNTNSALVEILQPLALSGERQPPHIESVSSLTQAGGILTIGGHNFNGVWRENSVLIDDTSPAVLKACSPVQLKLVVPKEIGPGKHTITVSCRDQKSNPAPFETFAIQVTSDVKTRGASNRLKVCVVGTERRVPIHVVNETPDKAFIAKGNDQRLTSSGGERNSIVLNLKRLKRGLLRIDAKLDEQRAQFEMPEVVQKGFAEPTM